MDLIPAEPPAPPRNAEAPAPLLLGGPQGPGAPSLQLEDLPDDALRLVLAVVQGKRPGEVGSRRIRPGSMKAPPTMRTRCLPHLPQQSLPSDLQSTVTPTGAKGYAFARQVFSRCFRNNRPDDGEC
jgi:hypothetical protein